MESQITGSTFGEGFNMDLSDFVIKNSMLRYARNIRIINHEGSSYVITNIKGTEIGFQITSGFVPVAEKEHNEVLYLVLYNNTTKEIEIGSYPSPDYGDGQGTNKYRPFNNLNNTQFRTNAFGIASKPNVDLTIQDDYDRSINTILSIKGAVPRIINSKFKVESDGSGNKTFSIIPDREGNANSNSYVTTSVEAETRLIVSSDKILGIDFLGIQSGGKIKPGNYTYVFHYMTEDQNLTNVVGQSSVCQVFFGASENSMYAGDETQETDKRVVLQLNNIDVEFKYLKVYALYSSGQEGILQQFLEFTKPITITGTAMQFIHTGFEELVEVSQDVVNEDLGIISGADTLTQINGYLFLAGIKEFSYDLEPFRNFAAAIAPTFAVKQISTAGAGGYMNPANTYNYLGCMGRESYPYGIVYVLPGGVLSPVFPTKGKIFNSSYSGTPSFISADQSNGVVTYPYSNHYIPFESGNINVKYIKMQMADENLISNGLTSGQIAFIKENSIGFFFVRGERVSAAITQGLLIPTVKSPAIESYVEDHVQGNNEWDPGDQGTYYSTFAAQQDSTTAFKFLPCVDSIMEAFVWLRKKNNGDLDVIRSVLGDLNEISMGYMPIFINDLKTIHSSYPEIWYSKSGETWARHWALLSGDAILDEPHYVTSLNRDNAGIHQLGKIGFRVNGPVSPKFWDLFLNASGALNTGLWYNYETLTRYASTTMKVSKKISFVPAEVINSGSDFSSRIQTSFHFNFTDGNPEKYDYYRVNQNYNSFFGVEMLEGSTGQLEDATKGSSNPIGGHGRIGSNLHTEDHAETSGTNYANNNTLVNAGFLVNIYPSSTIPTGAQLYPTIDNVVYRQVTKRFSWADMEALPGRQVDVFGGDCYIGKISRKLNHSPVRNPSTLIPEDTLRTNIHSGLMLTWWQESKFNLHLRKPYEFDASETEKRSFFPYRTSGDFLKYREVRYPETNRTSPGLAEVLPPKSFIPAPVDVPFIENEFFSRVYVSDKHIPNAFRNGFRRITSNFRDYTSSLGRIVRLFNHRGNLVVVFEHGIGVTSVEQRLQTGEDAAGAIFVEPKDVLPPNIAFYSQEIGSQDFYSMVQTPAALYGVDRIRRKIWQISEGMKVISDEGFASFLLTNLPNNMRSGFDPLNSEVLFTSDNWTLVFREGLERFQSFYSFQPTFYARRGNEFYSFAGSQFHRHNANTFQIYGENKDSIVEIVINEKLNMPKVLDYIEIISNEITPTKVEIFTFSQENDKREVLETASMNQYVQVLNENDVYTGQPRIIYRDKKYQVKVPLVTVYNSGSVSDRWQIKGRMRNKYFIIRLTYNASSLLQLASIISSYRYSLQ